MIAYRLFADETLILDTRNGINDGILSAKFKVEVNKPSSMEFSMAATHPLINTIKRMSMAIILEMMYIDNNDVVQDDYIPFIGRVTTINEDMYSNKTFTCEGGIAFYKDYVFSNHFESMVRFNNMSLRDVMQIANDSASTIEEGHIVGIMTSIGIESSLERGGEHEYDGSNISWTITSPIQKPAPDPNGSEEESDDTPTSTYDVLESFLNSSIISPYGGIIYFTNYYSRIGVTIPDEVPKIPDTIDKNLISMDAYYFSDLFYGFKHEKGSPTFTRPKEDYSVVVPTYGGDTPSFGLDDNIIDIKPSYVKTDIWTGILPVGKDGLSISGEKSDYYIYRNVIWKDALVQKYGKIIKQVNFSQVDNTQVLVSFANNYLARFASQDYYAMQTYEINGIEPCEVFEPTEFLIKLGYQVVLDIGNNLVVFPCLSLEHDLFDIQQSRYVVGPLIPDMILNEDFTAVYH